MGINALITSAGMLVSLIFAVLVLRQYSQRKKMHQLMWGIALVLWALGVGAELVATLNGGWADPVYRLYYTTGALLIPAWLGMGTLYLVFPVAPSATTISHPVQYTTSFRPSPSRS